jgi:hypothetical protein
MMWIGTELRLGFTLSFRQSEAGCGLYLEPAQSNEESLILLWELEPAFRLREGFEGALSPALSGAGLCGL